ncbi:MAG: TIGR02186 family protein [Sphingomonadaceae bacterium]
MKRLIIAALLWIGLAAQREPVLVPNVSQQSVEIAYSFTGAELLLFGAIVYPDGRPPIDQADIAVVLKGPVRSIRVREKQQILGIWVNASEERFRSAPEFYAIATSRPLDKLVDERTAAIYELGLGNIQLSPAGGNERSKERRFEAGLVKLKQTTRLFVDQPHAVEITEGVLYQARIAIPARVPVGRYTAETFLISKGKILAAATRDIEVKKSGFERFVANSADQAPVLYGFTAIALALFLGWGAGEIFRRV